MYLVNIVSRLFYISSFFHFSGGCTVWAVIGYSARTKSSNAVIDTFSGRTAIIGRGAPKAYLGGIHSSNGIL